MSNVQVLHIIFTSLTKVTFQLQACGVLSSHHTQTIFKSAECVYFLSICLFNLEVTVTYNRSYTMVLCRIFCQKCLWSITVSFVNNEIPGSHFVVLFMSEFLATSGLALPGGGMDSCWVAVCVSLCLPMWCLVPQWELLCRCVCFSDADWGTFDKGLVCLWLFILSRTASSGALKGHTVSNHIRLLQHCLRFSLLFRNFAPPPPQSKILIIIIIILGDCYS